jgi:hypothetical protein
MSAIKIAPSGSGAGILTLAGPVSSTDKTLTLPDRAGTLAMDGPSFSAYPSAATSLTQNVATKVTFGTELNDSHGCFNPATSRFQPTVAGWYLVIASVRVFSAFAGLTLYVYKNGANEKEIGGSSSGSQGSIAGSCLVYLNGTTDYVEIYCTQNAATQNAHVTADRTYFQGVFVRP